MNASSLFGGEKRSLNLPLIPSVPLSANPLPRLPSSHLTPRPSPLPLAGKPRPSNIRCSNRQQSTVPSRSSSPARPPWPSRATHSPQRVLIPQAQSSLLTQSPSLTHSPSLKVSLRKTSQQALPLRPSRPSPTPPTSTSMARSSPITSSSTSNTKCGLGRSFLSATPLHRLNTVPLKWRSSDASSGKARPASSSTPSSSALHRPSPI
ncbi:hypothetical protein BLNAU_7604 [Blattamonas nauphoetae]|uniref:Movement protein n=1 Tax=Blattamonas nauphoetae TaxID=2049346 RepID=A0ABQ9Y126_9EUKA|nr:hypothetical protein BLNAU_7604 [Blattamonas nauphoetae]